MNIQQAREIFDNYAPKLSASVWFFADEDELRTQHGVPQNVIEAMKQIAFAGVVFTGDDVRAGAEFDRGVFNIWTAEAYFPDLEHYSSKSLIAVRRSNSAPQRPTFSVM